MTQPTPSIPTLIAELRRLGEAATPRPWKPDTGACPCLDEGYALWYARGPMTKVSGFDNGKSRAMCDAAYLTAAANAVPLLVEEIERQQDRVNHLESRLEAVRCCLRGVSERYADGSCPLSITGTINSILGIDDDCEARFARSPDHRGAT